MGRNKSTREKRRNREERARTSRADARYRAGTGRRLDAFHVVEWRMATPNTPPVERLLDKGPWVSSVPGDTVYGIDFGDEEGPSLFAQSGPEDEPDWFTGLWLLPDGFDLAADEPTEEWRRDPDHLALFADLAAIGEQWWQENEAYGADRSENDHNGVPDERPAIFEHRAERERQLLAVFDRWTEHRPGMIGTIRP